MSEQKKCKYCAMMIPSEANICPHCRKKQGTSKAVGCLAVLIILVVLGAIGSMMIGGEPSRPNISNGKENAKTATSTSIPTQQKQYTSTEHLKLANECLASGYKIDKDIMKSSWGNVSCAKTYLSKIKPEDIEYGEAKNLLKEVSRREIEIKKAANIVTGKIMLEQRIKFAQRYENDLLSKGMDIDVSLSGIDKKTIKIKYILMNRPLVYKLVIEARILEKFKAMGFTRAILTDGYNYTWDININKFLTPKGK